MGQAAELSLQKTDLAMTPAAYEKMAELISQAEDDDLQAIRVFVSSTFRDMQAERDHLVRFVFPRLREVLLPRRIHLVDVPEDIELRVGTTASVLVMTGDSDNGSAPALPKALQ